MARAPDEFVVRVELNLATRMRTDGAIRNELSVVEMNQQYRTPRWVAEEEGRVHGHALRVCEHAAR